MRFSKLIVLTAATLMLSVPTARADEWNRLTYVTFSAPFSLPGVTLPAGTYAFKMADISGSHVVHVLNRNQTHLITTLMTRTQKRMEPADRTLIMFGERPSGAPAAVKAWYYPGRTFGEEFVYPKAQGMAIAKVNREGVLTANYSTRKGSMRVAPRAKVSRTIVRPDAERNRL